MSSLKKEKLINAYNEISESYEKGLREGKIGDIPEKQLASEERECALSLAKPKSQEIAADMGCGTGRILRRLAKVCSEVHGVDISPGMISVCKKKTKELDNVHLKIEDIESTSYGSNFFDLLTCIGVFDYYSEYEILGLLDEFARIIKPTGRIVVSFQNKNHEDIKNYVEASDKDIPTDIFLYSEVEVKDILTESDLKIIKKNKAGLQIQVLAGP